MSERPRLGRALFRAAQGCPLCQEVPCWVDGEWAPGQRGPSSELPRWFKCQAPNPMLGADGLIGRLGREGRGHLREFPAAAGRNRPNVSGLEKQNALKQNALV